MSRRFQSGDGFLLINEKLQKKKGKKYKGSGTTFFSTIQLLITFSSFLLPPSSFLLQVRRSSVSLTNIGLTLLLLPHRYGVPP
jgi:hypothetical protein